MLALDVPILILLIPIRSHPILRYKRIGHVQIASAHFARHRGGPRKSGREERNVSKVLGRRFIY